MEVVPTELHGGPVSESNERMFTSLAAASSTLALTVGVPCRGRLKVVTFDLFALLQTVLRYTPKTSNAEHEAAWNWNIHVGAGLL